MKKYLFLILFLFGMFLISGFVSALSCNGVTYRLSSFYTSGCTTSYSSGDYACSSNPVNLDTTCRPTGMGDWTKWEASSPNCDWTCNQINSSSFCVGTLAYKNVSNPTCNSTCLNSLGSVTYSPYIMHAGDRRDCCSYSVSTIRDSRYDSTCTSAPATASGSTEVSFNTAGWSCVRTATTSYWSFTNETISGLRVDVVNSTPGFAGNCSKYSIQNNNVSCCPTNNVCSSGVCSTTNNFDYCYKITSSDACNSASPDIGKRSVESIEGNPAGICGTQTSYRGPANELCVNVTGCGCAWENNKCVASRDDKNNCSGSTTIKICNWVAGEPQDFCGDPLIGKLIINYTVSGSAVGQTWCNANSVEYPCAVSVKMPFFDLFNFAIVSMGIAIGYLILRKK